MKMHEAMKIINGDPLGFMVNFELREGGIFRGDHFPDKNAGETLIETEEEAWELARKFAGNKENAVNIYVTDHTFSPVNGYREKKLRKYPEYIGTTE